MIKKILFISIVFWLFGIISGYADSISFLVLNMKGEPEAEKQWKPLANYLQNQIGQKVQLDFVANAGFVKRSMGHDILLTNPVNAVIIESQGVFEIIATLDHVSQGAFFAGVIIVRKDSSIRALKDLAKKNVGVVNKKFAAGGYMFQVNELLDAGLVPGEDFVNFTELFNQKAIIFRVISKGLDAGFIRTGILESLGSNYDVSQIRILNRIDEGLPYPRSTSVYPHWAILVHKRFSAQIKEKITRILLEIKPDSEVAKSGKMKGFIPAADYSSIKALIKRITPLSE